jgi:hypothetical protein
MMGRFFSGARYVLTTLMAVIPLFGFKQVKPKWLFVSGYNINI